MQITERLSLDGLRWLRLEGVPQAPRHAARQALRLLGFLRVWAPLAQAVTLVVVTERFRVLVPIEGLLVMMAVQAIVAIATFVRLRSDVEVGSNELFANALLDIAIYTGVLYMTGGTENPFAPLFVLPMVIVSSAIEPRRVWVVAVATMLAYVSLRINHAELQHPEGHTHVYALHEDGMVVNYVITAALLAFFCNRTYGAMRRNERLLADARDAQMRDESVLAIGALAAGYAHELGSPLSIVAVVTNELRKQHADNPQLRQDLELIADQVAECKRIVSNLASAGGQRRAESAGAARIDTFLESAIERARALHPGASIAATVEGPTPAPTIVAEETLRQAIVNLVQNAAQASPESVQVSARWTTTEMTVEVRDRGPGFPADMVERLGRRIEPAQSSKGLGLGLMLSAATLERMGGRLEIGNMPEGGARAAIRVPLRSIVIETDRKSAG